MTNTDAGDCLLVGAARSGTSLACSLLNQQPNVVALDEPYHRADIEASDPRDFPEFVTTELARQRCHITKTGRATSTVVGSGIGNHYDNPRSGPRKRLAKLGEITVDVEPSALRLVVKHTLIFAAHIEALSARMPVFALIRNPLAVLLSWNSIDADYRLGQVPGYVRQHVPDLVLRLSDIDDRLTRQVELLDWHYQQFDTILDDSAVIRFEDIVATDGANLAHVIAPHAEPSSTASPTRPPTPNSAPVEIRDADRDGSHDAKLVEALVNRLGRSPGHHLRYYSTSDIESLADDVADRG